MSSYPILWHEQCLENQIHNHKRKADEAQRVIEEERRLLEDIERYKKQIARAKKLGKKSFDQERFKSE